MKDWKYHCSVLGVRETASEKDVRRAFRRLALERHPDKHNNSVESTLEFQQLHESYEFLLSAITEGRRPRPTPPPSPAPVVDREAPTDPSLRAPVRRRPTTLAVREPSQWKMWLQMTAAAVLLLIVSVGAEMIQNNEGSPARKRSGTNLLARSSCLLKDAKDSHFEYETEAACHKRCDQAKNVTCSWNSVVFREPAAARLPIAAAAPVPAEVNCEITTEHSDGKPETISYQHQTEANCLRTCASKADLDLRAGIFCEASGKEIFRRARFVPPLDNLPREPYQPTTQRALEAGAPASELSNDCLFSSLTIGEPPVSEVFKGDTAAACEARCRNEINQHALDTEVRCSFAGVEIVTYVPDGTMAYLARNPAEQANGVRDGAVIKNTCDIFLINGAAHKRVHTSLDSEKACKEHCQTAIAASGGVQVMCNFGGREIQP